MSKMHQSSSRNYLERNNADFRNFLKVNMYAMTGNYILFETFPQFILQLYIFIEQASKRTLSLKNNNLYINLTESSTIENIKSSHIDLHLFGIPFEKLMQKFCIFMSSLAFSYLFVDISYICSYKFKILKSLSFFLQFVSRFAIYVLALRFSFNCFIVYILFAIIITCMHIFGFLNFPKATFKYPNCTLSVLNAIFLLSFRCHNQNTKKGNRNNTFNDTPYSGIVNKFFLFLYFLEHLGFCLLFYFTSKDFDKATTLWIALIAIFVFLLGLCLDIALHRIYKGKIRLRRAKISLK